MHKLANRLVVSIFYRISMAEEALDDAGVIIPEEEVDTLENQPNSDEDTVALQERLDKAEQAKSQILARAKKAEEELKKLKETQPEPHISNDPYFADELRLIADKVRGEAILKAKIIAKGSGITLMDAIKDPAVIAYIKDMDEYDRKEKAKLGASRGSGESQNESDIKPEMTREDHQKAFKKIMG